MSQSSGRAGHPGESLVDDPHRPAYHFLPPANWMNDPNGLIQWDGRYHLFYQHNPYGPLWGTMYWGHAVSDDLVHWTDLPIALAPTPGGPDEDGCWSGCAVNDGGTPTIIYTGVYPQRPCLATSQDDLLTWQKHQDNPIIDAPPKGLEVVGFRDHGVWKEGATWYQVIGSGISKVGGAALLYRSPNLIDWEYVHPLLLGQEQRRGPVWAGTMWECPDFFPLDEKHILVISARDEDEDHGLYSLAFIGTYTDHTFVPEALVKLDWGDTLFYAPQTLVDERGRRIMFGWIQEGRSTEATEAAGWAGVLSLPRVLSLSSDGLLGVEPASEVRALRTGHTHVEDTVLPSSSGSLRVADGDCLEIIARFKPRDADSFGLNVRCSPDGAEETSIVYDRAAGRLAIDRKRSSEGPGVDRDPRGGPLHLAVNEVLDLHIFLDRSIIEVYVNGKMCITSRVYPTRPDSLGVIPFARGGDAELRSLDIWRMDSIWGKPRPLFAPPS